MTDPSAEARIRELRRRITQDVTSPLFIGLAEEYRASGRLSEAIRTLEKGVSTHPRYVSAKVALARAYLEAGRTGDATALFTRILALDPGNLIAARALAGILLSRGEPVEALKNYRLYRALSGDRSVDEVIGRIEAELAPAPAPAVEPQGRVLAELYLEQGHPAEALEVYDELARSRPSGADISRLRAEVASGLTAVGAPVSPSPDGERFRRQAKVQALKRWLSVIQSR
jgi:tetratricopeptide (TPR) repeat protein